MGPPQKNCRGWPVVHVVEGFEPIVMIVMGIDVVVIVGIYFAPAAFTIANIAVLITAGNVAHADTTR
jgi:hypothetical protein